MRGYSRFGMFATSILAAGAGLFGGGFGAAVEPPLSIEPGDFGISRIRSNHDRRSIPSKKRKGSTTFRIKTGDREVARRLRQQRVIELKRQYAQMPLRDMQAFLNDHNPKGLFWSKAMRSIYAQTKLAAETAGA